MRWSVGIETKGDRVLSREEVAVATAGLPVYPIVRAEAVSEDEDPGGDG